MKTPYDDISFLKPIKCLVIDDDFSDLDVNTEFSVVISVKNEAETIINYIESIEQQTLLPTEVIFVDHASTDDTYQKIYNYAKIAKVNIKLFSSKETRQYKNTGRSTIAGNRNFGVSQSNSEIIVFTDCGNILPKSYFKSLVSPMLNPEVDLVGGIFHTQNEKLDKSLVFDWDTIDWNKYIPACRGQSIRKSLYIKCGGQPEWLTYAGEDAFYDYQYRRISKFWVFNKSANITWIAPDNDELIRNKFYSYGIGDGENGMGNFENYEILSNFLKSRKIKASGLSRSKFLGYLEGLNRRNALDNMRGVQFCDLYVLNNHPSRSDSSLNLIKHSQSLNHRTVCLILNKDTCNDIKYVDLDFSLLELWYHSDFDLRYFVSQQTSKIINHKLNIMIDPKNTSSNAKKVAETLIQFLNEIS